jgi:hypothetical protein
MDWAWASSLDHLWRSPSFPMWLTLAAAGFFGIILLVTLLRADRSVANGALTVITLLAIGVAGAATIRAFGLGGTAASAERQSPPAIGAALPALACIDDLAGETVLTACEKTLFGSAESTAAAISYAASQITRLTSFGDVVTANGNLTPELESLRRAVERDRYGLMAYVLTARDHCSATACPAFRSLANSRQIIANMDDRLYEGLVMRYSGSWNAPAAAAGQVAALPSSIPTGKPTNADFPSAASTPPVNIMTPEPWSGPSASRAAAPASSAPLSLSRPASPPPAQPAAKKQAAPKTARAPTPLSPTSPPAAAPAPAADNE